MQTDPKYEPGIYPTQKSRIFEMVFSDKRELPELFLIDSRLALYEHQSTYSPNLPLRYLLYVADLYSRMTKDENLYGTRIVKLSTPKFLVFYNRTTNLPDVVDLNLSDAFQIKETYYSLELKATLLNINPGHNEKLLHACKTLGDYSRYTDMVRTYAKIMVLKDAVEKAIEECIRDHVLSEFLRNNRSEAISVSIYEYDEERTMHQMREEAFEDGMAAGSEKERTAGINALIDSFLEEGFSQDRIVEKLEKKFQLSHEMALEYFNNFAAQKD